VTVVRELNAALRAAAADSGLKDAVKKAKKAARDSWGDFSRSRLEQSPAWKELLTARYAAWRTHVQPVLNKHSDFGTTDSEPYHVGSTWLSRAILDALGVTDSFDRTFLLNRVAAERAPKEGSLRIVARYLLKRAYEAGHIEPVGWGFVPGEVEENSFTGEGSIFPPHRDGRGDALENLGEIPTDGLTPMLSQNRAPKTSSKKNADVRFTTHENPSYEVDVGGFQLEFFPVEAGGALVKMGEGGIGGQLQLSKPQFDLVAAELRRALQFIEGMNR